jgi:RHS repeat-associated protein
VTDTYHYYAFGEELASTGSTESGFRYTGEQWDANAGFYYLRARYMDPSVGRFVSVDPFAGDGLSPMTLHRYVYANASPVARSDASGQMTLTEVMYTAVIANALAAGALVHYGKWLGRTSTPITWEGMVFPFTVSPDAPPELPFWFAKPGAAGGALYVDLSTCVGVRRVEAGYFVLMFGFAAGLGWNASGGAIEIESPGIFGADPHILTGPTIWASAAWVVRAYTGMTMGLGEIKKLEVGKIFGPDFGVEWMSGWSWLVME